jgi:hypothetical protein
MYIEMLFITLPFILSQISIPIQFFAKDLTDIGHYNSVELDKPDVARYFLCD